MNNFLYAGCQIGAETPLKNELARFAPDLRVAFSRPGFLTFKSNNPQPTFDKLANDSVFARCCGSSLGNVKSVSVVWEKVENVQIQRIHVWKRHERLQFDLNGLLKSLISLCPHPERLGTAGERQDIRAEIGETVLNVIVVEENDFWVGVHSVKTETGRFSGGAASISLPHDAVSRAWLKYEEAIRLSGFAINANSRILDIGSAPGGGSQALLARGASVFGVDPGEMSETVIRHPNFTHIRGRIGQLKRRLFDGADYIFADMNVAPAFTLDVLAELTARNVKSLRGAVFTLKFPDYSLADKIPEYIEAVKKMGFASVKVKQLFFNRQEVVVMAK